MKFQLLVLCVAVFAASICEVRSLTNKQFYELLEPYIEDVEDVTPNSSDDDSDIVLPGDADAEVNFDDIIRQLGADSMISIAEMGEFEDEMGDDLEPLKGGSCRCTRSGCSCCYSRRFKVFWKRFNVKVCAYVSYTRGGFNFRLTLNNRNVYSRRITRSLTVCYKVPNTFGYAKACGQVYGVNVGRKSFCLKLYAKVWKYRVTFLRKCFRFADDVNKAAIAADPMDGENEELF